MAAAVSATTAPGCIAIIPARGGSKGVPRKNVRALAGKPLIAHTIAAARAARLVDRVIVSTDDDEIAVAARAEGAEVITRPASISGDTASSEAALLHVLDVLAAREGTVPELVTFLQCTSPLTTADDIDGTIAALRRDDAQCALAVTPFYHFLWRPGAQGAEGINHDIGNRPRRQDMAPQLLETGAVYVMRTAGFLKTRHRFFGSVALYVQPGERCLEIDEPLDFVKADAVARALAGEEGCGCACAGGCAGKGVDAPAAVAARAAVEARA